MQIRLYIESIDNHTYQIYIKRYMDSVNHLLSICKRFFILLYTSIRMAKNHGKLLTISAKFYRRFYRCKKKTHFLNYIFIRYLIIKM